MSDKKNAAQQGYREKLESFIRWRWYLVTPVVVMLIASVIVSLFLPSVYEASSLIQITDKKIVDPLVEGLAISNHPKEQIDAMVKYIQSWPRLKQLIDRFLLAGGDGSERKEEELIVGLRKRIDIEVKGNDIVQIKFRDTSPVIAQKIVNNLTKDFIEENARMKKEDARKAIDFIGDQLKIYREKLQVSEKNFATHKVDSDLRNAQNRKKLLEGQIKSLKQIVPSQVKMEHSPVFAKLQTHLAELEIEKAKLMMDSKAEHPRLIELNREIVDIQKRIDQEMQKDMVRESVSMFNPSYFETEQELKKLYMDMDYMEQRKTELSHEGVGFDKKLTEEELATLQTSKKVDEDIYQLLLKQMEAAYVSERLQDSDKGSRLSVIEYARLPISPTKPVKGKAIFMGLFSGIVIGVGLVFLMEYLDRSFRTVEDAKGVLAMPVLGSISRIITNGDGSLFPGGHWSRKLRSYMQKHKLLSELRFIAPHVAKKSDDSGITTQAVIYHEPKCNVSEEFRILRTNIGYTPQKNDLKTMVFTSSVRSEGKSTTSLNLAIALADSGKNVLLIDGDLRRGMLHDYLNIPQSPGLAHVLSGNANADTVVYKTKIKNLSVVPCGTRPSRPSELLGSPRMETLMSKFKDSYDHVIVDAPPTLNLPDSGILAKYGDGVIFIVQAERTQREEVLRAKAMLSQVNVNVLGFVLTNVQYYIPKYLYDYYYGN